MLAYLADENSDRLKILEERVQEQNNEIKSLRTTVDDLVQRYRQKRKIFFIIFLAAYFKL